MENATKALLIAAGMLFAMMIVSLLVFGYNQLIDFQQGKSKDVEIEQVSKFNLEYESYNREKVRGSDLLTLVNKIVDYNDLDADPEGDELYEPMLITIDMKSDLSNFIYDTNVPSGIGAELIIKNKYTNTSGGEYDKLIDNCDLISGKVGKIKELGNSINGRLLTDEQLQKLSKNISNLFDEYSYATNSSDYNAAVDKRNNVIKEVFGKDITGANKIKYIRRAALEYFQMTQFKRANFKCTGTRYNPNTGRIVELTFEFLETFA